MTMIHYLPVANRSSHFIACPTMLPPVTPHGVAKKCFAHWKHCRLKH
jgi:hypothetical protein